MDKTWDDIIFNYLVCHEWQSYDQAHRTLIDNGLTEKAAQSALNRCVYFMKFLDAQEDNDEKVREH